MRTAEQILDEHCTTTYNKHNGEEEIESSKSAVVIAMEDYAKQQCEQLHIADVIQRSELFFAVLKWAKQADLEYPDDVLLDDFEKFTAKHSA